LAKTASEESDWAGLQHLIKFYKSRRFDAEIGLPKWDWSLLIFGPLFGNQQKISHKTDILLSGRMTSAISQNILCLR